MKKKILLVLVSALFVSLTFGLQEVNAGITASESEINISAGDQKTMCHVMIWSGIEGTTNHLVEYSDDINPYVSNIEPQEFEIQSYHEECGGLEDVELRECITNLCEEGKDEYCRLVCTDFEGPYRFELFPERREISGAVRNVVEFGGATSTNTMPFTVGYMPYPLEYVIAIVLFVIILAVSIYWFVLKK